MCMSFHVLLILQLCIALCVSVGVDEAFFTSCRTGDIATVKSFLESGVSVHARDSKGNTGLIIASGRGQLEVVRILLANGANIDDGTLSGIFEGKTPICWASSQGRVETVALLMQAGASPLKPPISGVFAGKNALMWAASQGRTEVVKFLISAEVDVDFSSSSGNFKGKTALMWASSQGRFDTVQQLLEAGSNVNAVDVDGVSALMWASGSEAAGNDDHKKGLLEKALKGHVQVIQLLLKYGALPDVKDNDSITAIMFASFHGHSGAVRVLLNAGANADYVNRAGKTAMLLARSSRYQDVVDTILTGPTFLNTTTFRELADLTTCGWFLSVVRAPDGTEITCADLRSNGFDVSLLELLNLVHGSPIDHVLNHFGNMTAAVKIRAKMQLQYLYNRFFDDISRLWTV